MNAARLPKEWTGLDNLIAWVRTVYIGFSRFSASAIDRKSLLNVDTFHLDRTDVKAEASFSGVARTCLPNDVSLCFCRNH